ncbi:hypothetical protein D3C86_1560060 [compost metagenome]
MNQNGPVAIAIAASEAVMYCSPQATSPVPPVRIRMPVIAFFFQFTNEFAFSPLARRYPKSNIPAAKKRKPERMKGGKPVIPKETAKNVIPQMT